MELQEIEHLYYQSQFDQLLQRQNPGPIHRAYQLMAYTTMGQLDKSGQLLEEISDLSMHEDPLTQLVFYVAAIDYFLRKRDLSSANTYIQEARQVTDKLADREGDVQRYYGRLIRLQGTALAYQGDFAAATEQFSFAMDIQRGTGDNNELARVLSNRAATLYWLGSLEKALEDALEAYDLFGGEKAPATETLIGITNNTGLILVSLNQTEQALNYFEQSLKVSSKIGNQVFQALNLHNIVKAHNILGNDNQARFFLDKFDEFTTEHPLISLLYRVSKGMVLAKSSRLQELAEGQRMLSDVIDEPIIDHQFTIMALFTAMDYLLIELEKFADERTLNDINGLLTRIDEIASIQAVRPALIQGNLIRSRLALINGDVEGAFSRLDFAKQIAIELRQAAMVEVIDAELEEIELNRSLWLQFDADTPLSVKLATSDLAGLISNIRNNQLLARYSTPEEPLFLIIMNSYGLPVYTNKFAESSMMINEFLISGFLVALDAFSRETFTSDSTAERIQFKGNQILMRSQQELIFVYAFTQENPSVTRKFDRFVHHILNEMELPEYLMGASRIMKNNLPPDINQRIDQAVKNLLLPDQGS